MHTLSIINIQENNKNIGGSLMTGGSISNEIKTLFL